MVAPILTTILAADWRIYDPDAQARPQPQARIPKPSPYNRSRFPPLRQLFRIAPASLARRSHCGSLKVQYGARKFGACGLQPLQRDYWMAAAPTVPASFCRRGGAAGSLTGADIGRASCRERVCQYG